MKRHNVTRVVLLGVGGVQKDDAEWIAAAARKYPDRVIAGLPVPDPTSDVAAQRLADDLARRRPRVLGEVHLRQLGRRNIEREPNDAAFGKVLDLAAQYGRPVVAHYELTATAAAGRASSARCTCDSSGVGTSSGILTTPRSGRSSTSPPSTACRWSCITS